MNHSYWLIVVFVAAIVCNTNSRPQENNVKNIYPVYRPSKELDLNKSNSSDVPVTPTTTTATEQPATTAKIQNETKKEKPTIESLATVARASSDGPSLSPSVAKVADQLRDTVGQMVESDSRTPPKLKEIIKEKKDNNESKVTTGPKEVTTQPPVTVRHEVLVDKIEANGKFELPDANERPSSLSVDSSEGKASSAKKKEEEGTKGIAVPVIMDEVDTPPTAPPKKMQKIPEVPKPTKDEKKKVTDKKPSKENPTTTPSSGLSTWILLSDNRESTTPTIKKKDDKKRVTTTKKPGKTQTTTVKPGSKQSTKQTGKKGSSNKTTSGGKKEEGSGMSALEEMVKNQKKNPATTIKPVSLVKKQSGDAKKKPDKISERIDEAETKDKVEIELSDGKKTITLPPMLHVTENPTTLSVTDLGDAAATTENPQESTTEKKKKNKNKKKKNKNRRKRPSNKNSTDVELKNNNPNSKNPKQPVGAQLYNFLSREIMPTVGLGLVGVLVTAGLAGLLGYNPFVTGNLPIRRTYESQHGYSPNNYYNYNTDTYNDGGQSEEVLFREVLSGMPEDSRYGLTNNENTYGESQLYNSQEQVYDNMKTNPSAVDAAYPNQDENSYKPSADANYEKDSANYDSTYQQDYSNAYGTSYNANTKYTAEAEGKDEKFPMYDRESGTSYVYPETDGDKTSRLNDEYSADGTKYEYSVGAEALTSDSGNKYGNEKLSAKYSKTKAETIEKQPEALYRVAGESADYPYKPSESTVQGVSSQNNWHRIGSPMDYRQLPYLEPGPRNIKFNEEKKVEIMTKNDQTKKRTKRDADSVIQRIGRKRTNNRNNDNADFENEIDFEDSVNIDNLIKKHHESTENTENAILDSTTTTTTTASPPTSTEVLPEETTVKSESTTESSTLSSPVTTESVKEVTEKIPQPSTTEDAELESESGSVESGGSTDPAQNQMSFLDVLKRLAQFKLKLGLNFLKSATDAFSNYIVDIQKKVDASFSNNTKSYYNFGRNPWARSLFRKREEEETTKERNKRSVLDDNEFLGLNLRKSDNRFLRDSKKETVKFSQSKKKTLKRYKSKKV